MTKGGWQTDYEHPQRGECQPARSFHLGSMSLPFSLGVNVCVLSHRELMMEHVEKKVVEQIDCV